MINEYRIENEIVYIKIKRKNGEVLETLIDLSDFELISCFDWYVHCDSRKSVNYYVETKYGRMNRIIMNVENYKENKLVVDHINRNTLDNRRSNLRIVTNRENLFNQSCKGYGWDKRANKWRAQIKVNDKAKYLGLYDTEEEAKEAYLKAKEQYHIISEVAYQS